MPDNWLLTKLEAGRVGTIDDSGKPVRIACDDAVGGLLHTCLSTITNGGLAAAVLPTTLPPTPIVAAAATAWEYVGDMRSTKACALVTRQADAGAIANRLWIEPPGILSPDRANLLQTSRIAAGFRGGEARIQRDARLGPVRLVIADAIDADILTRLERAGTHIDAAIIDGRSIDLHDYAEGLPGVRSTLLLAVSPHQIPRGIRTCTPTPRGATRIAAHPLLAAHGITQGTVSGTPVADAAAEAWPLLEALQQRRSPMATSCYREAWELAAILSGLCIKPSEMGQQFLHRQGFRAHPVQARLDGLKAAAAACRDPELLGLLQPLVHHLELAATALEVTCARRDLLLAQLRVEPGALVLVRSPAIADGVRRLLLAEGLDARVASWSQPIDWCPHNGRVLIFGLPPRRSTWALTTAVGRDVTLVLGSQEAAILLDRIKAMGIERGRGLDVLKGLAKTAPRRSSDEAIPPKLADLIPGGQAPDEWASRPGHPSRMAVCLELEGNGRYCRYYAPAQARIATLVEAHGRTASIGATSLKPGQTIILSVDDPGLDVKEGAYLALESREGERQRIQPALDWKRDVRTWCKDHGLDAGGLARALAQQGYRSNPDDLEDIFSLDGAPASRMAVRDHAPLVRATLLAMGRHGHGLERSIVAAVQRWRGLHRIAGRTLHEIAEHGFFASQHELEAAGEAGFRIRRQDIHTLAQPFTVIRTSPPFEAPSNVIGLLTETTQ